MQVILVLLLLALPIVTTILNIMSPGSDAVLASTLMNTTASMLLIYLAVSSTIRERREKKQYQTRRHVLKKKYHNKEYLESQGFIQEGSDYYQHPRLRIDIVGGVAKITKKADAFNNPKDYKMYNDEEHFKKYLDAMSDDLKFLASPAMTEAQEFLNNHTDKVK